MTESKEKDTKETTPEATPEDVNTLIEKTLAAEEKTEKGMRPETKIAVIAAGLSLISIIILYCVGYSNRITDYNLIVGGTIGSILGGTIGVMFGGTIGVMFGGIFGGIIGIAGGIAGGIVGGTISGIVGGILGDSKKGSSVWTIFFLTIVFFLPFTTTIVPFSKYHNLNQIERDKKIVEILQVTSDSNNLRILLPPEYVSESSYMEKVFSIRWAMETLPEETVTIKAWKDIAIPCRDGDKYWRRAEIKLSELSEKIEGNEITLFFDHAREDYETTKEISFHDPNSL